MNRCGIAEIIKKEVLREGLYDVTVKNGEMAYNAKAGQFLHIDCGGKALLRRPISICDIDKDTVRFIFEVRGEGTDLLKSKNIGEFISILGPLGNGFTDTDFSKKTLFVGGGIGIFPLLNHAKKYGKNAVVLLGFRDKENAVLVNDFEKAGCTVKTATDDGSLGHKGFVTDLIEKELINANAVFACGPYPMLKKTAMAANKKDIFCEISMEERMGCGIGACLVCACRVKVKNEEKYLHVCKDGPVFNAKELVLE